MTGGVHFDDETLHDYSLDDRYSGDDRQKLTTISVVLLLLGNGVLVTSSRKAHESILASCWYRTHR